ncbi:hypothetical protein BY996DRAFT_7240143 [Phakopsora pachyrhizi]|nr:hypothetical protein BY996DRAFT_7240143 [Phakopsora pachyrhizi]
MRSFVYCAFLILFCQLAISSTIIERSDQVEASNEQFSEKQYRGLPRPPPPPPRRPPPPPPRFGRPPPRPFGVKDNSQNEKRSEVAHAEGQSTEKFLPGYGLPLPPPPFVPLRRPFGFGLPPPLPFGFKDSHHNDKRSEVESSKEKSSEKFFGGLPPPFPPPLPPFGFLKDAENTDKVRQSC